MSRKVLFGSYARNKVLLVAFEAKRESDGNVKVLIHSGHSKLSRLLTMKEKLLFHKLH